MPKSQQENGPAARPLLERRSRLGISYALIILFVFFFFMPFAFRSARLSLKTKKNDIKDWLPSDFIETSELKWFADHFIGESFVIATWPGCTEGDQRLKLLEAKLRHECSETDPTTGISDPELAEDYRSAREYGERLGLLLTSRELDDWGGSNEKWFATTEGQWYFITPDGHLNRWEEPSNGPAALVRSIKQALGSYELTGTFVAAFGNEEDGNGTNPFHNDPSLVSAPLFRSVRTGVSLVKELSKEGGLLWPVDFTDQARRPIVARRRAMERLTGSLFAPAVPDQFTWTAAEFRDALPMDRQRNFPDDSETIIADTLQQYADDHLESELGRLETATTKIQTDAWYAVFDALETEPPPRQTCLMITLTETAENNLPYVLGRGVMGGPRGRLLELATDSGIQAAAPPSMAPPPFNRQEVESLAGAPPLRLGGPPVDNISIDEEGTITLVRLVGYSVLVGALLSYLCFGSFKITIMVFVVGGAAAMLSMAFVNWTGGHVDAILMSMPSLVYVLGLSGAIHVVNYYRDEVRRSGRVGAAGRALRHALFPCSLAALTTAIGLGSLVTSNLAPISNFGLYSAIGVIATLGILFSYLPAALQVFATEAKPTEEATETINAADSDSGSDSSQDDMLQATGDRNASEDKTVTPEKPNGQEESWLSDQWAAVGGWISRHHLLVTTSCLIVLIAGSLGLRKIETSVQLLKLFDSDARIIRDYSWLEKNFGKLVPMELVLRVPPSMQSAPAVAASTDDSIQPASEVPLNILERVEAVARVNHVVMDTLGEKGLDIVGSSTAVNTFLKPLPEVTNGWNPIRSQYVTELTAGRQELLSNDYMRIEEEGPFEGSELWRISLRVGALSDVDYGEFITTLRTAVEPVLRAYDTRDALLRAIADDPDFAVNKKPVLVLMGAKRPETLSKTELVTPETSPDQPSEERIDTRAIYLATLEELIRGERLPQPLWMDHLSSDKPIEIGSELWDKVLKRSDLLVWVGTEKAPTDSFDAADKIVDGQAIFSKPIEYKLTPELIPDVGGSGAMQVVYTGVVPVVYKAQRTLLGSLVDSIALAFVLIAIVMIVLLNPARNPLQLLAPRNAFSGFMAGAISMIPNMFPVLLVFGIMGHMGRLVDIGTMMTASVAMGVAVDDTIHFLSWFRSYLDRGYDRIKAVEMTYRRVGPAMTQTTIVGGLGLFVFALSTFTPTQRFGTLMLVLLSAALIGDLVLLPALLAGPLGKFFRPRVGTMSPGHLPDTSIGGGPDDDGPHRDGPGGDDSIGGDQPDGNRQDGDAVFDKDSLPQLRLHAPSRRADQPHRMKGR